LRLRDFFRHKHSVVAKHPDAVANIQSAGELHELYALSGKFKVYGMAGAHNRTNFNSIFSSGCP